MTSDLDTDDADFLHAFSDVKPLAQDKADISKSASDIDYDVRRKAAVAEIEKDSALADAVIMIDANALVEFKRPGVQLGVFKKLRLGKYESQARLDLHGMTVDVARREVEQFVKECMQYELRVVTLVHGKGTRSSGGKALLKSHCVQWLPQIDDVVAFHSAQAQHGGNGALYVLLRKSDTAKQRNRELHGGRQ